MNRINEMNAQELRVEIAKERGYTAELDKNVRKRNSGIDRYPQNQRYRPRRTGKMITSAIVCAIISVAGYPAPRLLSRTPPFCGGDPIKLPIDNCIYSAII